LLVVILLQSCGASAENTPEPTPTTLVTFTPTNTAEPTFTSVPSASPTIIRLPTQDFNATPTIIAIPIFVGSVTATLASNVLTPPEGPGPGFADVTITPKKIFWGGCEQNKATINAEVEDQDLVAAVIIFTRVKDLKEEDYTPWTKGNIMFNNRDGTFTFIAIGSEIRGHNHYKDSWVYFQMVAVDDEGKEVGRTKVYEKAFSMSPCPCLTPVTGCPFPTQKKP
jgi:hypothetical protein